MDENEVYFSYAKNGDDLGVCFQVEKSQIEGQAMFPLGYIYNTRRSHEKKYTTQNPKY
jgi:hypothetical protein